MCMKSDIPETVYNIPLQNVPFVLKNSNHTKSKTHSVEVLCRPTSANAFCHARASASGDAPSTSTLRKRYAGVCATGKALIGCVKMFLAGLVASSVCSNGRRQSSSWAASKKASCSSVLSSISRNKSKSLPSSYFDKLRATFVTATGDDRLEPSKIRGAACTECMGQRFEAGHNHFHEVTQTMLQFGLVVLQHAGKLAYHLQMAAYKPNQNMRMQGAAALSKAISPLKARTGPSIPAPEDDAAAPSVHHSRETVRTPPLRQSSVSGRTFKTCWKNNRIKNSNCTVCATGSWAIFRSISLYFGKEGSISSSTDPRSTSSPCTTSRRGCCVSAKLGVRKMSGGPKVSMYATPSCRHCLRCPSVPKTVADALCIACKASLTLFGTLVFCNNCCTESPDEGSTTRAAEAKSSAFRALRVLAKAMPPFRKNWYEALRWSVKRQTVDIMCKAIQSPLKWLFTTEVTSSLSTTYCNSCNVGATLPDTQNPTTHRQALWQSGHYLKKQIPSSTQCHIRMPHPWHQSSHYLK